jgi:hypothetical protein
VVIVEFHDGLSRQHRRYVLPLCASSVPRIGSVSVHSDILSDALNGLYDRRCTSYLLYVWCWTSGSTYRTLDLSSVCTRQPWNNGGLNMLPNTPYFRPVMLINDSVRRLSFHDTDRKVRYVQKCTACRIHRVKRNRLIYRSACWW